MPKLSFASDEVKAVSTVDQDNKTTSSLVEVKRAQDLTNQQVADNKNAVMKTEKDVPSSKPEPIADVSPTENDMDGQKAMEQALQATMLDEAMAYYPIVSDLSLDSKEENTKIVISYDQPTENDSIKFVATPKAEDERAEIFINTPLLQKSEFAVSEGDGVRVSGVNMVRNEALSAKLGAEAKFFFVGKIIVSFSKPLKWKINQSPGLITMELSEKSSSDEEDSASAEKNESSDIVYEASMPRETNQILGQSFANERQYEKAAYSDGQELLLDQLSESFSAPSKESVADYSRGISQDAIKQDMKYRYPAFGSLDYWKKHVSGAVMNTMSLMKRRRNQHPMLNEVPGLALVYDRKGSAHVKMGYNLQREFPFFYGKQGHLAHMDGFMRQDIRGGVVYKTKSPWVYSVQNQLSLGAAENTAASAKFGDRLNTYRYELGQALRYSLKRGFLQFGSGLRWQGGQGAATSTNNVVNNDLTTYLSALWVRPLSKKWTGQIEYNYMHTFEHKPQPAPDTNVHKVYAGLDYQLNKDIKLSPRLGWAFYDGEAFAGWVGELNYKHKLSSRDLITLGYSTDFIKNQGLDFGLDSLASTQSTFNSNDDLIRYQIVSANYKHDLTESTTAVTEARYRRERLFERSGGNKLDEYRLSLGLNHRIRKDWALELRYALIYQDASRLGLDSVRTDAGNTEHHFYFRVLRYLGESVK